MNKPRRTRRTTAGRRKGGRNPELPEIDAVVAWLQEQSGPCRLEAIAKGLDVPEALAEDLADRLEHAVRRGRLVRNRREAYGVPAEMDLTTGRVIGHADGFGFVHPEEGGDDLFLSVREMRRLLHGDRVVARTEGVDRRGRPQGAVVEILERANEQVVGRFFREAGIGFVVPANSKLHQDILVPPDAQAEASEGEIVVARITAQPDEHRQPVGEIAEVLGEHMAPGMEIDIAVRMHELPYVWPEAVIEQTGQVPERVRATDIRGREDLRELALVTIDGEDARDFDDAVYCEREGRGWRLIVAIADVSHYVRPGTPLDAEAERRGTSVYFPGRVIPMLPPELSNGICSLVPEEDRLCLACEMHFDAAGQMTSSRFFDAVMRSHARLTYDEVAAILLAGDKAQRRRYEAVVLRLECLHSLYKKLLQRREQRGALEIESTETRIQYDEDGRIAAIEPVERNDAHRLIEECMIAANIAAAELLEDKPLPGLFRVHLPPGPDKVADLRTFLGELGLGLGGGDKPGPRDFAALLAQVAGRGDRHLIQTSLLRSLKMAVYSIDNDGHFGLALDAYTHFTSPIRRYPDLLVHRIIRRHLKKRSGQAYEAQALSSLADYCSMTERRAEEASRDVVAWLKCEYMSDRVGEAFDGTVSAVTGFGLFIELDGVYIEGLVHISSLGNDYYHFDPVGHRLSGKRTGTVYRLADRVRVRVTRVDIDERKIDLELLESGGGSKKKRRRRRAGGR